MNAEHKEKIEYLIAKGRLGIENLTAKIVFVLVVGVIGCAIYYMATDLTSDKNVNHLSIKISHEDSLALSYSQEGLDSLVMSVREYERKLDEKYQYLLDQREDDDRFKTWGALVVGVIVSVCSFWGYKSIRELKEDVKKQTAEDIVTKVNEYLENNLNGLVKTNLTNALRSDITQILKQHVMEALNSDEDNTISTRVKAIMESERFEKQLKDCINERVVEVVDDMVIAHNRNMHAVDNDQQAEDEHELEL